MTRTLSCYCMLGLLTLLVVWPSRGHAQGSSRGPTQPGASIPNTPRQPGSPQAPGRPADRMQGLLYVSGRILMGTGQPAPEPVSVEINCGGRTLRVIHTDFSGFFTFDLGTSFQGNMDYSASNENPGFPGGSRGTLSGGAGGSMSGCELRVSVSGYQPLNYTLSDHADMGRIEVGTLHLRRIAGVEGSAISVTSLLVPGSARKEFEKAQKELHSNHPEPARQHLEKAVGEYDKYAAAWNELGRIYSSNHEAARGRQAFEKAIAADPQYIPPYVSLAAMLLQDQKYESAVETAEKVLELDPSIGFASFIQAVGNYNLNRLDAAEKSAREAEKGPHGNIPQVHALLANIFLQKQDFPDAAAQMRSYLKEAPQGQFAEQMKKDLAQIEKSAANAASEPGKPDRSGPQ